MEYLFKKNKAVQQDKKLLEAHIVKLNLDLKLPRKSLKKSGCFFSRRCSRTTPKQAITRARLFSPDSTMKEEHRLLPRAEPSAIAKKIVSNQSRKMTNAEVLHMKLISSINAKVQKARASRYQGFVSPSILRRKMKSNFSFSEERKPSYGNETIVARKRRPRLEEFQHMFHKANASVCY